MAAPEVRIIETPSQSLRRRRVAGRVTVMVLGMIAFGVAAAGLGGLNGPLRLFTLLIAVGISYSAASSLMRTVVGAQARLDLVLAGAWLALVLLAAALADFLPLAESRDPAKTLDTPILLRPDLFSSHPLGTDRQGLDILGGVVYGARVSMVVGIGAVLVGLVVGGTIGLIAGYRRGVGEWCVQLITDSLLAFPPLIFLLGLVTVLTPSTINVVLALGVLSIPTYVRLARANTLTFAQRDFILSARALGERDRSIVVRELLPNVIRPVLAFCFVIVAVLIVAEASLSFLGLGVQRPTPTWGNMIAAGQENFDDNPHLVLVPGAVLFFTVFSFNRIGDFVQTRWEKQT